MYQEPPTAILRLPDELFHLVVHELFAIYPAGGRNKLGWLMSTHVCARLRRIVVEGCAVLWGRSLCSFPKAVPTFLERAGDAKLSIRFVEPNQGSNEQSFLETNASKAALRMIFQRSVKQIQGVCITFPSFKLRTSPHVPPPIDFDLSGDNDNADLSSNIIPENASAIQRFTRAASFSDDTLNTFMGKMLPDLEQLELIVFQMQDLHTIESVELSTHSAFIAPNMVSLKLLLQRIHVETLVNILRNSPLLSTLKVQWADGDAPSMLVSLPPSTETLLLPRLKDVSLGGREAGYSPLISFWRLIRAHNDVRLHLIASSSIFLEEGNFCVALTPWLQRRGGDTLTMRFGARRLGVILSSSTSSQSVPQLYVHIELGASLPMVHSGSLLSQLFTILEPAHIHVLNFRVDVPLKVDAAIHLARLSALEEICVQFDPDGAPFELENLLSDPDIGLLFPALRTLLLTGINVNPATAWKAEGYLSVANTLQWRMDAGAPVSRLVLRGMSVGLESSLDNVESLKTHVAEVVNERLGPFEGP